MDHTLKKFGSETAQYGLEMPEVHIDRYVCNACGLVSDYSSDVNKTPRCPRDPKSHSTDT